MSGIATLTSSHSDGLEATDVEEHYRKRTVLGVKLLLQDSAEAVMHFASAFRR